MSKPAIVLIGHGVSGEHVVKELTGELSKINLVVIESREHWENDNVSPVFLYDQKVFEKNNFPIFGKSVDGVTYMNDIVESVSPSEGGRYVPSFHPSLSLSPSLTILTSLTCSPSSLNQ